MKKTKIILIVCLLISNISFSQEKINFEYYGIELPSDTIGYKIVKLPEIYFRRHFCVINNKKDIDNIFLKNKKSEVYINSINFKKYHNYTLIGYNRVIRATNKAMMTTST